MRKCKTELKIIIELGTLITLLLFEIVRYYLLNCLIMIKETQN